MYVYAARTHTKYLLLDCGYLCKILNWILTIRQFYRSSMLFIKKLLKNKAERLRLPFVNMQFMQNIQLSILHKYSQSTYYVKFTECYKKTFTLNSRRRIISENSIIGKTRWLCLSCGKYKKKKLYLSAYWSRHK